MQLELDLEEFPTCKCCRKNRSVDGVRCLNCKRTDFARIERKAQFVGGVKYCVCCTLRPSVDGQRCSVCISRGGSKIERPKSLSSIDVEWRRVIESRQSGLRQRAKQHGSRWATREHLASKLVDQSYRCWFTLDLLKPSEDIRLAHLSPASQGGSFTIDNLVWTTNRINRMMGTMHAEEFIAICQSISVRLHEGDTTQLAGPCRRGTAYGA